MKRFTLILVAALMVMANAMAQPKGKMQSTAKKVAKQTAVKAPERPVIKLTDVRANDGKQARQLAKAQMQQSANKKSAAKKNVQPRKRLAASKAQRRAAGVIIEQPEGTYHNMVYSCSYYGYSWLGGLYNGTYTDALGEVVEGTDGNLYIHNMMTEMYTEEGYWVKAEKVEGEADTYVIHKQPIYVEDYYGTIYTYYIMKATLDAAQNTMVPAKDSDIKLTWKDGKLRTASEFNGYRMIATIGCFDDTDAWSGALNWNVTMTPQTDTALTELPAGAEPQEMVMKYISGYKDVYEDEEAEEPVKVPVYEAQKVQIAVSGTDIYLQYYTGLDSWIKGSISNGKASFPNKQYLGPDSYYGQHIYFIGADNEGKMPENVVFDYDATTNKLSNSQLDIYANGGKSSIYYVSVFINPEIFKFVETAATPQPVPTESMSGVNYNPNYGYGWFDFDIPYFDADGNYMNPEKLYYKIYFGDDENKTLFTFTPEEYPMLEGAMTEVPFGLSNDAFWTSGTGHEITLFVNQAKNLGVQVIYKGGDQVNESEISWYGQNNGAGGFESVFPQVEEPTVNSNLAEGEVALNLGEIGYAFGTNREDTESFDVAMKIEDGYTSNATLAGKKIVGVSVPFFDTKGISNTRVWLSTSIETDAEGNFTPNGPVKEFTLAENGYTTVKFDQPYEIPEEGGIFIGYSFTQAYDEEDGPAQPIALTYYTNVGGFMIHSDKVYRLGWASMEGQQGDLALEAILTGFNEDAAEVKSLSDVYAAAGQTSQTTLTVANYGCKDLQSIDYNYSLRGYDVANEKEINIDGTGSIKNINLPRLFGGITTATIELPAVQATGDFILYADATKANDKQNTLFDSEVSPEDRDAQAQCNFMVMNFIPKKRALMEEYTGTWCGYCPRGFVGLEKMGQLYPDDFIALSYHNDDPMEVTTEFPSDIEGFPSAYLDRAWEVDAYYGTEEDGFGIDKIWQERNQEFGVADINVEAAWSDDQKTINVKATAKFPRGEEYADYRLAYAVVADGLSGTSDGWAQSNYYANGANGYPEYMDVFSQGESYVSGLVFNDVMVASSPYEGVEGSLPETIEEAKEYTHEYSFNAADIVNTAGEPVIQNRANVKVVAILVSSWGTVYNVNRCKVTNANAIGDIIKSNNGAESVEYYDLSGRKIAAPAKGMYIKSVRSNGKTVNEKVLMK